MSDRPSNTGSILEAVSKNSKLARMLYSPNPQLVEDREAAMEMIEKYNKTPVIATKRDKDWFWKDTEYKRPQYYAKTKEQVLIPENFSRWNEQYPFELTEWIMEWYTYMPDILWDHVDNAGQIDWNFFFSLIYPLDLDDLPFVCLVKALNVEQNRRVRQWIYQKCTEDEELRNKILNNQPIPSDYTYYTPYSKIQREVMYRLKPHRVIEKDACYGHGKIFKIASKLIKEENLTQEEAIEKAWKIHKKNLDLKHSNRT